MTITDLADLSHAWNEPGRGYFTTLSERLTRLYRDGDTDVDLDLGDPRSPELGAQVVEAVVDLNARGQWQRARELFDPAHAPLTSFMEKCDQGLHFVAVLGPDELLVHRGNPWQPEQGQAFHLHGGTATPIPDVRGLVRSRGRDVLVLARAAGLEVRDATAGAAGLDGPPVAFLPWPDPQILRPAGMSAEQAEVWDDENEEPGGPFEVEQLAVSDDGLRIAVSCYRQGILLASRHPGEPTWRLLWPDPDPRYNGDDEYAAVVGDMTHVAISPDGTRLAWGDQSRGHFLAEIGEGGVPTWYATVGHLSEYPHHACFSDDGRYVALNSCHFYQGATVAFDWNAGRGVELEPYDEDPQAPCVDHGLRVYAAGWLDAAGTAAVAGPNASDADRGAFLLAGSGVLRITGPTGTLHAAQGFGSSAGALDFCPRTRRLALASYSGFVHLFDVDAEELTGRIDGYRPRREVARWLLWEHLPNGPVRW